VCHFPPLLCTIVAGKISSVIATMEYAKPPRTALSGLFVRCPDLTYSLLMLALIEFPIRDEHRVLGSGAII